MAKILILTNALGGLYTFRRELIQDLLNRGDEVYISAPRNDLAPFFTDMGCHFVETPFRRRRISIREAARLVLAYTKQIRSIDPRVVLTYTIKPNIYGGIACRLLDKPYLANITGLGSALDHRGILQRMSLFLYRIALKEADCLFFQNTENREFFRQEGIIAGRERLIPGSGVNLEYFSLQEYPCEDVLHFLFIGRIMKEKGIDQYLEAARYITHKYENTEFHVVGRCEDHYEELLKDLMAQGIIKYHGRTNEVRPFYQMCHCTVHPTYYPEGISNVLLESAASGRPVITTDRSGCREVVDAGVNGFLVKERDSKGLIEAIEKFIRLPYEEKKKMGLAGRAKVERQFDRRIVVAAYLQEIDSDLR